MASTNKRRFPIAEHSIAVLPFVNMSDEKSNEYFSDGISEELLNLLAKIPQLQVTARTSSFSFKGKEVGIPEIARRLHVAHVLEGSVRKAGNSVRITAQLIEAGTDTHVWSQTYDRKLDDIFAIQDEIAADVVKQLRDHVARHGSRRRARPTPRPTRSTCRASKLGKQNTAEAFQQSDALFRKVLAIDPRYAPAWAGLATTSPTRATWACCPTRRVRPSPRGGDEGARDRSGVRTGPRPARLDRDVSPTTILPAPRSTSSARWRSIRRIWTCCATAPSCFSARPPGRGAGARRGRRAPRSGERDDALQPGLPPAHGRPVRRGDRVVPHRAEPRPGRGARTAHSAMRCC
jgi:TolB-like protein